MSYSPAGNLTTTGTLAHLATVYYNRKALDVLRAILRFSNACEPDLMPKRNGKTVQWFRYSVFGNNTIPSAEGTVGTSLTNTTSTISATVSEYSDFVSVSTLLQDTAIDDIVTNISEELGYRAAKSVDTIIRTEFDSTSTPRIGTLGASLSAADFRRAVALLKGVDVLPKSGEDFYGIAHPYVIFDLQSDNTAGGFIDASRYANPQALLSGEVGKVGGVRIMATTNVSTDGTAAPNAKYRTYVVGKGAVGAVSLAGNGPSMVEDPNKQSFAVNVIKGGVSQSDPEGMIGSFISYRYVFVAKILDATNYRFRVIEADASII